MSKRGVGFLCGCCVVWSAWSHAQGAEFFIKPISSTGLHVITGNEIVLDGPGQVVTLEVRLDNWIQIPDVGACTNGSQCSVLAQDCAVGPCVQHNGFLGAYQVRVDEAGYQGILSPVLLPADQLIDISNPEYVFFGLAGIAAADTSTDSYAYGALVLNPAQAPVFPGTDRYGGTLQVNVPAGAIGTFTIGFVIASVETFMLDSGGVNVTPLVTTPAIITIACQSNADCNDNNACTTDVCNLDDTCSNTPNFDANLFCCNPVSGSLTIIDDGNECTVGVCDAASGAVIQQPRPAGTVCGNPAQGACDAQDTCDLLGVCVDRAQPAGTACGDPTNTDCNNADTCDGGGVCLANIEPVGVACGDPTITDCDRADTCDGAGTCLDNLESLGTSCGSPADTECDNPDTCDGVGACLANVSPVGLPCGNPIGNQCDNPDSCDGAGSCLSNFVIGGTACGNPANTECDNPDTCDGGGICDANRLPDGATCTDDGNQCRDDVCLVGVCSHPLSPVGTFCGDPLNTDCNLADTCDGAGTCLPNLLLAGTLCGNPDNTICTDPDTCNGFGTCQPNNEINGTPCDIGAFCTDSAACAGGVCGGGVPLDCGDGLACTADSCNEPAQACDNVLIPGNCLIDGVCHAEGALNPANDCEICDSVASPTAWTLRPENSPCSDGDVCTGPDVCSALGVCAGTLDPACNDDCINAVQVFDGANVSNNDNRGPDDAEAVCQPVSNNDVWFFYVASCTGPVMVDTIGSLFTPSNDTVLSVYGACGSPELACDDDAGPGLLSFLEFDAAVGQTYFIRVAGFLNNSGDISLNISTVTCCVIDGLGIPAGAPNPLNECEACIPQQNSIGFSPRPAGSLCGDPAFGECDSADSCDGNGACEINHKPNGTPCSDDGNDCSADLCGNGACEHPFLKSGTACGDTTSTACDAPDTCDGLGLCLVNFIPTGVLCGDPATSECDNADVCDGVGACNPNHQPDGLACTDDGNDCTADQCSTGLCVHPNSAVGSACGDAGNSGCDNPDSCDGAGICLPNFEPGGFACGNPADTECDNPDTCNGAGSCLVNFEGDTVPCGSPIDTGCDNPDTCDGVGSCRANLELSGFPCGDPSNTQCDNPDTCDGIGGCLANFEISGVACGDPTTTECDNPDACDGGGACLVNNVATGTACSDDGNDCSQDFCDLGACTHPPQTVGTPCGNPADTECDNPDTCNATSTCLDNFEPVGTACGAPTDSQCDHPDSCDGGGGCLANLETNGTVCDDSDLCTGGDACVDGLCEGDAVAQKPLVSALGSRRMQVTPLPLGAPGAVALRVTSPDWPCLSKFIAADGSLTLTPVFQLIDVWGTIVVEDLDVVPDSTYVVEALCGAFTSVSGSTQTAIWGDADGDGVVTLADVQLTVLGFQGFFNIQPLEVLDLWPCLPDRIINFDDILQVVIAFQGGTYLDTGCSVPCP